MRFGRALYFADFWLCPALVSGALVVALCKLGPFEMGLWALWAAGGAAAWTLIEYVLHRWAFHQLPGFRGPHESHHAKPNDYVGAPSFLSIAALLLFVILPLWPAGPLVASGAACGMLFGYTIYIFVHHASHFWVFGRGTYLYRARMRHNGHHFFNQAGNFGVTTDFWDRLFGTAIDMRRVRSGPTEAAPTSSSD